jgi:hypothetical protein
MRATTALGRAAEHFPEVFARIAQHLGRKPIAEELPG